MRAQLGLVGRRIVRLLRFLLKLLLIALQTIWRKWGIAGLWLRHRLVAVARPILAPPWRFLGRMGLAWRNLLTWALWRPFRFMAAPWYLLYRQFLHRPLMRALGRLLRTLFWPVRQLARLMGKLVVWQVRARQQAGRAGLRRIRRRVRSSWMVMRARLSLAVRRPPPPKKAIHVPAASMSARLSVQRRVTRLATTAIAVGLIVVASFFTAQQAPRMGGARAVSENNYQLSSSKFAESTPTRVPPTSTPTPVASPTPWPTPDPLNSGGSVAFTLRQNGNSDLYVLSIGQSQPVRLTNHPAGDRDPAWSPDGRQLAFASRRDGNWEIYVLNLPDGRLRRLTRDTAFDGGPSWSPDGRWLVFESYRANNLDLYLISADGEQGPIRLTQHEAPDFSPAWSPDGRHVAFTSWRSGNKDIFIMSLDTAADDAVYNVTGTPDLLEDNPAFSPDGDKLAFSEDSTGFELVYALPLDEYTPAGEWISHGQGRHPSWSPDGKALAYIHGAGQNHLIASSLDAWSVAPQAFTTNEWLDDPNWSARTLSRELPDHLQALNEAPQAPLFVESVDDPQAEGAPYLLRELPVNAPAPYLNDHVDQSFLALRQRVVEEAGWDFLGQLDQMYERIDAKPPPGQSARNWNKAGRAFDYFANYALALDPRVEIVREDRDSATYWRTYLRAEAQDGSQGEPLRDLPWDFRARYGAEPQYYDQGGKWKEEIPDGYYVDFTALAADYGWTRVPTADNWRTFFPGILFWRYENRQGLNWEQAMLEIYTAEEILSVFR